MNLESRARRAAASLKASVAGLAAPAGAAAPAPSHRRLVGGLAIGGALAAALLLVAVLVLPSSGDPQTVAGGDLATTTTAGAAVIDGPDHAARRHHAARRPLRRLPRPPGPHRPGLVPRPPSSPAAARGDGQSGQAAEPGDDGGEGDHSDLRPGFWASQAYGCSAEEEPAELFFGGGDPGETITLASPFGSATAVVGEDGYWEASLAFAGAAYGEPFMSPSAAARASPGNWASWSPTRRTAPAPRRSSTGSPPISCGGARWRSRPPTCSTAPAPPATPITLASPYGSATVVVDESGWWETRLTFEGAPLGEPFDVIATAGSGEAWALSFTAPDPENGECVPPMEYWFSAYQGSGCSVEAPPTDYFYGTGIPGDIIEFTSPYGSACAVVDDWGWWEATPRLRGRPLRRALRRSR